MRSDAQQLVYQSINQSMQKMYILVLCDYVSNATLYGCIWQPLL